MVSVLILDSSIHINLNIVVYCSEAVARQTKPTVVSTWAVQAGRACSALFRLVLLLLAQNGAALL